MKISVACLIYRSTAYADAVYRSFWENIREARDRVDFFFMANDPTPEVVEHLRQKKYKHYVNVNPRRTDAELLAMGYAGPEYIHRVYRGWNAAIHAAADGIVVLVNSDNLFSAGWLEALLPYVDATTVACSQLIEPYHPRYKLSGGIFKDAIQGDFGRHPNTFDKAKFLEMVLAVKTFSTYDGGAYMPCAFLKSVFVDAGCYPEGNISKGKHCKFDEVARYGDAAFFDILASRGIRHITVKDSVVYHFKEGEMDE